MADVNDRQLISLVEEILKLNDEIENKKTPTEIAQLSRQVTAIDTKIDQLVYKLYGISAKEIELIEGGTP